MATSIIQLEHNKIIHFRWSHHGQMNQVSCMFYVQRKSYNRYFFGNGCSFIEMKVSHQITFEILKWSPCSPKKRTNSLTHSHELVVKWCSHPLKWKDKTLSNIHRDNSYNFHLTVFLKNCSLDWKIVNGAYSIIIDFIAGPTWIIYSNEVLQPFSVMWMKLFDSQRHFQFK